jgi:hypothetical protein
MVARLDVWVQAQEQLGITSDLPAAAVAICCGRDWVSFAHNCLLLAEFVGILYLGVPIVCVHQAAYSFKAKP